MSTSNQAQALSKHNHHALKQLEGSVLDTVETLRQLAIMVDEHQPNGDPSSEQSWYAQLNNLTFQYERIRAQQGYENVLIPRAAMQCVDAEESPDLYLQDLQQLAREKKQLNRGRTEAIQTLRDAMQEKMHELFPKEMEELMKASNSS